MHCDQLIDFDQDEIISDEYQNSLRQSIENLDTFWARIGRCVEWTKPWKQVLDNSDEPFTKWYVGGELNACYNALDRHVKKGSGQKVAVIYDSPQTGVIKRITYDELLEKVSKIAGVLSQLGVRKGDRVLIYMPIIPEVIVSMLACARLGAVHSVVFGGFAAGELSARMMHAEPKVVMAATFGIEPNRLVRYKEILEEAFRLSSHKPDHCIMVQRRNILDCPLDPDKFIDWDEALSTAEPHECVPVEANEPLYILYTSGTTGQPKGIQRPVGGHLVSLTWSLKAVYGIGENDVWWAASDLGWVVGHSYMCYGPLSAGVTSVMYEGKPVKTPNSGEYFRLINDHKIKAFFTVPTALRAIKREDPDCVLGRNYDLSSLKHIFVAGEHCDLETKNWTTKTFGVPVLNHWWQTETGHPITATCVGLGNSLFPPRLSTGLPIPGYNVCVLRKDGSDANHNELGRIAIKLPLPPGNLSTLYKNPEAFRQIYFSTYPGYYDTVDAGYIDEQGYVYILARDDDIINVAGHRLSTSAIEEIVLSHPHVSDAAVIGVPNDLKSEVPLCLFVQKEDSAVNEIKIRKELIKMVRDVMGPVAAFKLAVRVKALPRTRSGKTCRKSVADLARNQAVKISATVEDPTVYKDIKRALQKVGFATLAPDPE